MSRRLNLDDLRVGCEPDAIYFGRLATLTDLVEVAESVGGEVRDVGPDDFRRLNPGLYLILPIPPQIPEVPT